MKTSKILLLIALMTAIVVIANAQQATTGIKVNTAFGGTLSLDEKELTSLFDNDTYTIPIEKPGTYSVKMKFANGKEATKSVVISARGIMEINFLIPPKNIQIGTIGTDTFPLYWDSSGTGTTYNVYYNTVNHIDSAKMVNTVQNSIMLQNLKINSTYYVWVSVVEGGMEGVKSTVISKELLAKAVEKPGSAGGMIFYDKGFFVTDGSIWKRLLQVLNFEQIGEQL